MRLLMEQPLWQRLMMSSGESDSLWELFHENSKLSSYQLGPSNDDIIARMKDLHESLPFEGYPITELSNYRMKLDAKLEAAIISRVSCREMTQRQVPADKLATLLHYAYGVNRDNYDGKLPRPFRVVPSAGALYPLEIFFHTARVQGLQGGIYHYNPSGNFIRLLKKGNFTSKIAEAMTAPNVLVALNASILVFITALFERSVFKYGERGYRFVLLEAGHVGQNINLVSSAMGLSSLNIGGFFDRAIDDLLGLDGVTHSTVYIIALG